MMLTQQMAMRAYSLAEPTIRKLMDEGVTNRRSLCVVVAVIDRSNPAHPYRTLAESSISKARWEDSYDKIAHAKTHLSARTGLSAREVQYMRPELLQEDDVKYWGNAVFGDLIVSCSGVQPWIDEVISNIIGWLCLGFMQNQQAELRSQSAGYTYSS